MSKFIRPAFGVLCVGVLVLGVVFFDPSCMLTFPSAWDPSRRDSWAESLSRGEELQRRREASF
jgi:hypothetical protein